jgi:hypothetical protein
MLRTIGLSLMAVTSFASNGSAMFADHYPDLYNTYQSSYYYNKPHTYPLVISQPLAVLPPGSTTVIVGPQTFFYHEGIFFQKSMRDQKYVVVPPPIGAVVHAIPEGFQMIMQQGLALYEYNGVYYRRVLEGFKVIPPPVSVVIAPVAISTLSTY